MFRRSRLIACAGALLALAAGPALALAADGDEDPSFNGGQGSVIADMSDGAGGYGQVRDPLVVQASDGDLVGAAKIPGQGQISRGVSGDTLALMRVRADGSYETGFDGDGRAFVFVGPDLDLLDMKALAGNAAGVLIDAGGQLSLRRVNENGSSGTTTVFTKPECAGSLSLEGAALRADGTVVAVWQCTTGEGDSATTARVLARNAVDGTIQGTTPIGDARFFPNQVRLGANRIFVVGGWFPTDKSNEGTKVIAFDGTGARIEGFGGEIEDRYPNDATVDSLGRIVLGLQNNGNAWYLVRLTTAGAPDSTFSDDGVAEIDGPTIGYEVERVATQDDGAILALGLLEGGSGNGRVLVRITPGGALDSTFAGGEGRPYDDDCNAIDAGPVIVQADGKAVVTFSGFPVFGEGRNCSPPQQEVRARAATWRSFAPPQAPFLAIARVSKTAKTPDTPTQTTTTTTTTQQQPPPQAPPRDEQQPSLQPCKSVRNFKIRLRTGRKPSQQSPIVGALVLVNGKRVSVSRSDRVRAQVDLRGLPLRKVTVRIRLRLADGGTVRDVRRYNPCVKGRLPFTIKPLHTKPPR